MPWPNLALEPTAASGLRRLMVPSSPRSSAAAQRKRWASLKSHCPRPVQHLAGTCENFDD